jgi:hypothetical protein
LVLDKTCPDWPASIAAVGLGLTAYPAGVERGFVICAEAVKRTLTTLRFFWQSKQGPEPVATGYKGFYYHFLDIKSGARVWQCELSTVDSALLLGGMLACAAYFDENTPSEQEIRDLVDRLYARVDWQWAQNGGVADFSRWERAGGHQYGFMAAFNPTFPDSGGLPNGWVSPWHFGINEGPIVAMVENYKSGLIWQLMRECKYIVAGLRAAGFTGGWLSDDGRHV